MATKTKTEERDHIDRFLESIRERLPMLDPEVEGMVYRSSPGRLARIMELSSGAMTNRLDRLEEAGLLRRLPDPDDRRGILVELTADGKRVYEEAVGVQARKEALVASALTVAEKKQLNALLRRMMLEFERAEGGPPPEEC